jgi:ParB family transcriptional regulator, chromosome partitioning protein
MSAAGGGRRLGKGLGALLGDDYLKDEVGGPERIRRIPVAQILPNPFQPRREFVEEELAELRESIRVNGLLQPPMVRPASGSEGEARFELVAGERRFRCVRDLGWSDVPVVVREVDDRTLLVLALVENIQREALGVLEEAEGYRVLSEEFGLTQEEIAEAVGKSRPSVANALRLLRLPVSIRRYLETGELSMGHARALLGVSDPGRQAELARRAVERGWSVREIEERARPGAPDPGSGKSDGGTASGGDPVARALAEELRRALGSRAELRVEGKGKGRIIIPFRSDEDFDRLFRLLTGVEVGEVTG